MRSILLVLLLTTTAAFAAQKPKPFGAETRTWLNLQKSAAARTPPQPIPGEVADQVYQRYLKSFSHPIPEQFRRERFVEGGGGR